MKTKIRLSIGATVRALTIVSFAATATVTAPSEIRGETLTQEMRNNGSQVLPPIALANRCYSHLTRQALPPRHKDYAKVVSGERDPIAMCLEMLDSSKLKTTGNLEADSPESRRILATFHDLHRTWFPADDITRVPFFDCYPANRLFQDPQEPALHVTRSLFYPGSKFSDVVTGTSYFESIRANEPYGGTLPNVTIGYSSVPGADDELTTSIPGQPTGTILGVRTIAENRVRANLRLNGKLGIMNPYENFGGGILGSSMYVLLNIGRDLLQTSNGGVTMPRRWAKAVLADLMCRDLPVIRISDADLFVNARPSADTPPFRTSRNCMQCHASMDPLSGVARHLSLSQTSACLLARDVSSVLVHRSPTSRAAEAGTVDADPEFHLRPAKGTLFYRSFDGSPHRIPVTGLKELGEQVAKTDDFYVCAAARYFQYFTGIKVNLQDIGDTSLEPLNDSEVLYRQTVIQLGTALKEHQRLDKLVGDIMRSPLYQSYSQREMEELP